MLPVGLVLCNGGITVPNAHFLAMRDEAVCVYRDSLVVPLQHMKKDAAPAPDKEAVTRKLVNERAGGAGVNTSRAPNKRH